MSGINIDRTRPSVRALGARHGSIYTTAPKLRCAARDRVSGIASCKLASTVQGPTATSPVVTTHYRMKATSKAGKTRTIHGSYRTLTIYLQGAGYQGGAFTVHGGRSYNLIVADATTPPRYIDAAPAPAAPAGNDNILNPLGHNRWEIGVIIPMIRAGQPWYLGVQIGASTYRLTINER